MLADLSGYTRETGKEKKVDFFQLSTLMLYLLSQEAHPSSTDTSSTLHCLLWLVQMALCDQMLKLHWSVALHSQVQGNQTHSSLSAYLVRKWISAGYEPATSLYLIQILLTLRLQNLYGTLTTIVERQPAFKGVCKLCQPSLENDFYERPRGFIQHSTAETISLDKLWRDANYDMI